MPFLRQSTIQTIRFGPCLDKTDGVTEELALTLAQADMRLSKDGGAYAQKNAAGNATHDSDGHYSTTLDATDTNTVGELKLNVHQPANMLPVWDRWWVIEEAIYDLFYGAGATGLVTLAAVTHAGAVIPTISVLTGHTVQTGDSFTRLGAPAGASVSADNAALKVDTAATLLDTGTDGVVLALGSVDSLAIATSGANEIRDAILSDSTPFLGASIASILTQVNKIPEGIKKNTALNSWRKASGSLLIEPISLEIFLL